MLEEIRELLDLQGALAVAQAGDEVWVVEGVYKATPGRISGVMPVL